MSAMSAVAPKTAAEAAARAVRLKVKTYALQSVGFDKFNAVLSLSDGSGAQRIAVHREGAEALLPMASERVEVDIVVRYAPPAHKDCGGEGCSACDGGFKWPEPEPRALVCAACGEVSGCSHDAARVERAVFLGWEQRS